MSAERESGGSGFAGAFGVNYALRPHKFVDRRVFVEVLSRFASFQPLHDYVYVGLGSFAMEDHKLINSAFGTEKLISLEVEPDVVARQVYNSPLACIKPTPHSTDEFVASKDAILKAAGIEPDSNLIVWFDMTDAQPLSVHLNTFEALLRNCAARDIVRFTVDVDGKTLARRAEDEPPEALQERRFYELRELLGPRLKRGAKPSDLADELSIASLVLNAFKITAEQAFNLDQDLIFEPLSLTTYADGHRMLSVTGAVLERDSVPICRERAGLLNVPGGAADWSDLTGIQIPQLTVWEKMNLDRKIPGTTAAQLAADLNFKLHETIPTTDLLSGYVKFHRFYPNFRHFVL